MRSTLRMMAAGEGRPGARARARRSDRAAWLRRAALVAIAVLAMAASGGSVRADNADAIVARVGTRTVTAAELERRMAALPPFQLRTFGSSAAEIRKNFLERVVIRELLFVEGAVAENLADRDDVQDRVRAVLRNALLAQLRADTSNENPVTDQEIASYYEGNRGKFQSPPRLALWRILVPKREQADAVLAEARKDLSQKHWNDLARDRSVDKQTSMRGGDLGFVAPDGSTAEPGMKVDPILFEAAMHVRDGELVPEPVKEGDGYAVIWRRQAMRAVQRTLEQEAPSIRQILVHQRTEERVHGLVERLRTTNVAELHPDLVDQVEVTASGDLQAMRRPGSIPVARHPAGAPVPVEGPSGLR